MSMELIEELIEWMDLARGSVIPQRAPATS